MSEDIGMNDQHEHDDDPGHEGCPICEAMCEDDLDPDFVAMIKKAMDGPMIGPFYNVEDFMAALNISSEND